MPVSDLQPTDVVRAPAATRTPLHRPHTSASHEPQDDLLILVHGTYASRVADEGDNWWQNGSGAWRGLQQRLPEGVRMPKRGEVFHWSGENSERDRIKAARELLEYLDALEARGQAYHLIGHSHGGSVIWNALRMATIQKKPLDSLVSWATVGTPFLHHKTRGAWNIVNLVNIFLALVLLKPAYLLTSRLLHVIGFGLLGIDYASTAPVRAMPTEISLWRTPVLQVMEWLGISVETLDSGFRIGSFDSTRGDSMFEYLFFQPEGWLVLGVALLVIYVYLNLGVFFLMPVLESIRIRFEKRLERNVMETYRGRWLGLWSPDDEAINGLRATLDLSISFVARMEPRERILLSDNLTLLSRPYYWLLTPLFNRLLRPVLDGWVRSFVVKVAQGNNRPAAEVVKVSPSPISTAAEEEHPPIPDWLNERIVRAADHHAVGIAPKLRTLLAETSFLNGLERFGETISGRELVHTSYFDHPEILDLLAMHVACGSGDGDWETRAEAERPELADWLIGFKRSVGVPLVVRRATHHRTDPPEQALIRPRRR